MELAIEQKAPTNLDEALSNQWFKADISRKELKELSRRSDWNGILHYGGYFGLIAVTGVIAYQSLGTVWFIPAIIVYGTIFGFSDAAWHETAHGTPFKTRWLNEAVHFITAIMGHREVVYSRWSHAVHHSYTSFVGDDPEQQAPRSPNLLKILINFFRIEYTFSALRLITMHALGIVSNEAKAIVPSGEYRRMIWNSRLVLAIYIGMFGWAIAAWSWLPLIFFFFPRNYGAWLLEVLVTVQHPGLAENVWDHRLNTRTVKIAPWLQFLYFNMNYHIEHHMFPTVPFHALAKLHKRVESQYPPEYKGLWSVYRNLVPTLVRQVSDPNYYIHQEVPEVSKDAPPRWLEGSS